MGSSKDQGFYSIWDTLGVVGKTRFRRIDSFGYYKGADNKVLNLYTNHERLKKELLTIAPEDAGKINELCGAVKKFQDFNLIELKRSVGAVIQFFRALPALLSMGRWTRVSVREWCAGLKNAFLREAIPPLISTTDIPIFGPILVFGMLNKGRAAYPLGGSLPIALAAEEQAKSLGAEIIYRSRVKRVLVERGRAIGVELEDGRVQRTRHVVSACDARLTFESLLEGKIKDPAYEELFRKNDINPGIVQVSLGVRLRKEWGLESLPKKVDLPLSRPIQIDKRTHDRLYIYQYAFDPSMAEEGRTALVVQYVSDYEYWKALRGDMPAYRAEKKRVLDDTIQGLEGNFPGISAMIEASDVSTPVTSERYTGNWRGSTQGWALTTEWMAKLLAGFSLPKTFKDLAGFYLIGQWTEIGGGLPPSIRTGRDVVRMIKKADRKRGKPAS